MHTTEFELEHPPVPSVFSLKLRKHLRGRRLDSASLIGSDRVAVLSFFGKAGNVVAASGSAKSDANAPNSVYLILEFYAGGNIILCDESFVILQCLRTHLFPDGSLIGVNQKYPFDTTRSLLAPSVETMERVLADTEVSERSEKETLKGFVSRAVEIGPILAEHCVLASGVSASASAVRNVADLRSLGPDERGELFKTMLPYLEETVAWLKGLDVPENSHSGGGGLFSGNSKGYILLKKNKDAPPEADSVSGLIDPKSEALQHFSYDEFSPLLLAQYTKRGVCFLEFENFDAAVDTYFVKIAEQRLVAQAKQQKLQVTKKIDKIRENQERRAEALAKGKGKPPQTDRELALRPDKLIRFFFWCVCLCVMCD
jgi:nuclear export mediator factor NEMF